MRFYGIKDFFENKELYKIKYMLMTKKEKRAYKRFVYSISFENEYVKDVIWEYLNDDMKANENITNVYNQRINRKKNKK